MSSRSVSDEDMAGITQELALLAEGVRRDYAALPNFGGIDVAAQLGREIDGRQVWGIYAALVTVGGFVEDWQPVLRRREATGTWELLRSPKDAAGRSRAALDGWAWGARPAQPR